MREPLLRLLHAGPRVSRRPHAAGSQRRRRARRGLALAAGALAVVAIAACGKSQAPSPQQQVRATLQRFGRAVAARDYRTVCEQLLAPSLTERLLQIGLACETGLARGFGLAQNPTLTVKSVRVSGERASAVVHTTATNQSPSDDTISLVKLGNAWRISALGAGSGPAAGGG